MLALASGLFYVTRYAINSWGIFFLQEAKGYSVLQAGSIVSVNAMAGLLGTVASGFLSDRVFSGNRFWPALGFGLLYIGATSLFVLGPAHAVMDTVAMALFGWWLRRSLHESEAGETAKGMTSRPPVFAAIAADWKPSLQLFAIVAFANALYGNTWNGMRGRASGGRGGTSGAVWEGSSR